MAADERVHKKASFAPRVSVATPTANGHHIEEIGGAPLAQQQTAAGAGTNGGIPQQQSSPLAGELMHRRDIYSIHGEQVTGSRR